MAVSRLVVAARALAAPAKPHPATGLARSVEPASAAVLDVPPARKEPAAR